MSYNYYQYTPLRAPRTPHGGGGTGYDPRTPLGGGGIGYDPRTPLGGGGIGYEGNRFGGNHVGGSFAGGSSVGGSFVGGTFAGGSSLGGTFAGGSSLGGSFNGGLRGPGSIHRRSLSQGSGVLIDTRITAYEIFSQAGPRSSAPDEAAHGLKLWENAGKNTIWWMAHFQAVDNKLNTAAHYTAVKEQEAEGVLQVHEFAQTKLASIAATMARSEAEQRAVLEICSPDEKYAIVSYKVGYCDFLKNDNGVGSFDHDWFCGEILLHYVSRPQVQELLIQRGGVPSVFGLTEKSINDLSFEAITAILKALDTIRFARRSEEYQETVALLKKIGFLAQEFHGGSIYHHMRYNLAAKQYILKIVANQLPKDSMIADFCPARNNEPCWKIVPFSLQERLKSERRSSGGKRVASPGSTAGSSVMSPKASLETTTPGSGDITSPKTPKVSIEATTPQARNETSVTSGKVAVEGPGNVGGFTFGDTFVEATATTATAPAEVEETPASVFQVTEEQKAKWKDTFDGQFYAIFVPNVTSGMTDGDQADLLENYFKYLCEALDGFLEEFGWETSSGNKESFQAFVREDLNTTFLDWKSFGVTPFDP